MEKTTYELKPEVQTASVPPKTLQTETQMMTVAGVPVPMYPVYGRTDNDSKVWCATFFNSDEAEAWVQASKVFGRVVLGAVIAQQEKVSGAGEDSRTEAEKAD